MARTRAGLWRKSTAIGVSVIALLVVGSVVLVSIAGARSGRTSVPDVLGTDVSCTTGMPVLISGYYYDKKTVQHGFVYRAGKFTTINDPSATTVPKYAGTSVYGISSDGGVGGTYNDSKGVAHGFIEKDGRFTTINDPSAGTLGGQGTFVWGMNDLGIISGWFTDSNNVDHGFEDIAGEFSTYSDP